MASPPDPPLRFPHVMHTYRYLFSNGMLLDVVAAHESATVRQWALQQLTARLDVPKDVEIVGVAILEG